MKTNHTQGEWVLIDNNPKDLLIRQGKKGFVIAEVTTGVAQFIGNREEADANARLIAAAPELLNCCIDMLRILELNPTYDNLYQRNKISHAIEKATQP